MKRLDGEELLKYYPKYNKWINECIVCHKKGYRLDTPDFISIYDTIFTRSIKKAFKPLTLNENGVCEHCEKTLAMSQHQND